MKHNTMLLSASMAALVFATLAATSAVSAQAANNHNTAINACTTANEYQPVNVVAAIDNGSGYTLVWLTDTDGDLWMCHADNHGSIYAYEVVDGDLLEGEGPEMINLEFASNGEPKGKPQQVAEKVCTAAASLQPAKVIASRPDGLSGDWTSGFSVFLQDDAGDYYLCNATGDASIWAWAPLGDPLEFDEVEGVS
jgi:hypothetical protein